MSCALRWLLSVLVDAKPVIFVKCDQKKIPGCINHFVANAAPFLPGAHPKDQDDHDQRAGDGSLYREQADDQQRPDREFKIRQDRQEVMDDGHGDYGFDERLFRQRHKGSDTCKDAAETVHENVKPKADAKNGLGALDVS
jgi:hypothetical protein